MANRGRNNPLPIVVYDRHDTNLTVDGTVVDAVNLAKALWGAKVGYLDKFEKLTVRNARIDEGVVKALHALLQRDDSYRYCAATTKDETTTKNQQMTMKKKWTKLELIHCSGLISKVIQVALPLVDGIAYSGSVPLARRRYSLDDESLKVLGAALKANNNRTTTMHRMGIETTVPQVNLSFLSLKGTRLGGDGWAVFCESLKTSTTLTTFELSHCALETNDVNTLASSLRENKYLNNISFATCKIGSTAAHVSSPQVRPREAVRFVPAVAGSGGENGNGNADVQIDIGDGSSDAESITLSTNNTNPQTHFSHLLEALVGNSCTLKSLKILGMYTNEASVRAIGAMLSSPNTALTQLGLKNNLNHPDGSLDVSPIFEALKSNNKLTHLQLAGNNINNEMVDELTGILAGPNKTIQALILSNNLIGDEGIRSFACRLPKMTKSLRAVDLQRNRFTDEESKNSLIAAMEYNVDIQRFDLDGTADPKKAWWLTLNKAGRRLLTRSGSVVPGLWPRIIHRAMNMHIARVQPTNNFDVVHYFLRRAPEMFEPLASSEEEDEEPKRKRQKFSNNDNISSNNQQPNAGDDEGENEERVSRVKQLRSTAFDDENKNNDTSLNGQEAKSSPCKKIRLDSERLVD
jgi:Leucine Rich repeat